MRMVRIPLMAAISRERLIKPYMPPQAIWIDDRDALSPWDDESEVRPLRQSPTDGEERSARHLRKLFARDHHFNSLATLFSDRFEEPDQNQRQPLGNPLARDLTEPLLKFTQAAGEDSSQVDLDLGISGDEHLKKVGLPDKSLAPLHRLCGTTVIAAVCVRMHSHGVTGTVQPENHFFPIMTELREFHAAGSNHD
jgi:hypothetical protein